MRWSLPMILSWLHWLHVNYYTLVSIYLMGFARCRPSRLSTTEKSIPGACQLGRPAILDTQSGGDTSAIAAIAQLDARRSHNPKAVSSILTRRTWRFRDVCASHPAAAAAAHAGCDCTTKQPRQKSPNGRKLSGRVRRTAPDPHPKGKPQKMFSHAMLDGGGGF